MNFVATSHAIDRARGWLILPDLFGLVDETA